MNQKNRVPAVLNDYAVYLGNNRLVGTGEITLPNISPITAEVSGAGIGGTLELPVVGHYESMTIQISWRTMETDAFRLMAPIAQDIVLRASQQVYDGAGGTMDSERIVVFARVTPKPNDLGRFNPGEGMDGTTELEVLRLRIIKGVIELCDIDKLNGICRILGYDYSRQIREDLGI
jgi:P2 family phage contractile tail tube protein